MFVWKDKQDRISRKTTEKSVKDGGLGIPNLESFVQALQITWLRKVSQTKHKWKSIALHNFPFLERIQSFGPNIATVQNTQNCFWKPF